MFNKKEKPIKYRTVEIIVPEAKFKNFYRTENGEMFLDLGKDWQEGDLYKGTITRRNYRGKKDFCSEEFVFEKEKLAFRIIKFSPDENKK